MSAPSHAVAFENNRRIAGGPLAEVALEVRRRAGTKTHEGIHIFDAASGRSLQLNLTGSDEDVRARYSPAEAEAREKFFGALRPYYGRRGPGAELLERIEAGFQGGERLGRGLTERCLPPHVLARQPAPAQTDTHAGTSSRRRRPPG